MTRAELINHLEHLAEYVKYSEDAPALREVIEMLKDNGDCISRQAAIELAMQYCPDDDGTCSKADEDIRNLLDELEELPPVQPEQPQLFQAIRKVCKYHTFSRDRYGTDKWEDACHCPVMIPQGSSWGECNEGICPVFNS